MARSWQSTGLFAAGGIAGAALVLGAYLGWFAPEQAAPVAVRAQDEPVAVAAPPTPAAQAVAVASSCPAQPVATPAGEGDGRFSLQAALATGARLDAAAFASVARESAQQGRWRDAEVALLAACHAAEHASGRQSGPLADVKSQLGQQYVAMAAREAGQGVRDSLLQRAGEMFADSAGIYAAVLGRQASKTRLAEERLAAVRNPESWAAGRQDEPSTSTLGAAPETAPRRTEASLLVNSDPELAQLEHDLQRLRAQAASVSRDPAGLDRRDAAATAQRNARCQDKDCLLQWYEQRRRQLLAEF